MLTPLASSKRRFALISVLVLAASPALSGCMGASDDPDDLDPAETPSRASQLRADRGAIAGLLVDDRFRPLANGLILLRETGQTARTNADGEFTFTDLRPGPYTLRADIEGHEAAPREVDVRAGEYAEAHVMARRILSEAGTIITQEYTVFIACSVDFVVNGIALGECVGDLSGDSGRSGFTTNYTELQNVTYVVTEMQANQDGRWEVQIRARNETCECTDRYAAAQFAGDYVKIVNKMSERNTEHEAVASYGENAPFDNAWPFQTILWTDHEWREEFQSMGLPVCCGIGATFGIKARFVQSIFLGEPEVDIATYQTMS